MKADDLPLDRLASNSHIPESEKIASASRAFEALLLRQVLQEAQRPVFKSKYASDSTTSGIYRDLVTEQLAESMSKSGNLGLAQSLACGLQPRRAAPEKSGKPDKSDRPDGPGRLSAASEPLPSPSAPQPLSSPKMKDMADRKAGAPPIFHLKTHHD